MLIRKTIIRKVILTDKIKLLNKKKKNIYSFYVDKNANKNQIRESFKQIFREMFEKNPDLKIKRINTLREKQVLQKLSHLRKYTSKRFTKLKKKAYILLNNVSK